MKWTYRHTNIHTHMLEKKKKQLKWRGKIKLLYVIYFFSYHKLFFMGFKPTKGLNFQ